MHRRRATIFGRSVIEVVGRGKCFGLVFDFLKATFALSDAPDHWMFWIEIGALRRKVFLLSRKAMNLS
jgi:hypothetical protein